MRWIILICGVSLKHSTSHQLEGFTVRSEQMRTTGEKCKIYKEITKLQNSSEGEQAGSN